MDTLAGLFGMLWLVGVVSGNKGHGAIHILLVAAIAVFTMSAIKKSNNASN